MRGGALPAALLCALVGLMLATQPRRVIATSAALLIVAALGAIVGGVGQQQPAVTLFQGFHAVLAFLIAGDAVIRVARDACAEPVTSCAASAIRVASACRAEMPDSVSP